MGGRPHPARCDTADGYRARGGPAVRATPGPAPPWTAFFRDWLKLDDVARLDARNGNPVFKAFAGPDLPKPHACAAR